MAATGYINPTNNTGIPWNQATLSVDMKNQIGEYKMGAVQTWPNTVSGAAVRQKQVAFTLTSASQASIAHGAVDENGNAATPVSVEILFASTGTVFKSQAPDSTNIYLKDPSWTSGNNTTGVAVITY